jgi:hypothetical protein
MACSYKPKKMVGFGYCFMPSLQTPKHIVREIRVCVRRRTGSSSHIDYVLVVVWRICRVCCDVVCCSRCVWCPSSELVRCGSVSCVFCYVLCVFIQPRLCG